jgi:hypothetical protein
MLPSDYSAICSLCVSGKASKHIQEDPRSEGQIDMQVTTKSDVDTTADSNTNAIDDSYVGKHRPYRMSLLHPRVRVSRLAGRNAAQSK